MSSVIEIKNIQTLDRQRTSLEIKSSENHLIDGSNLLLFPGLIDPHVHFRTPGLEHKENWEFAAQAALKGGITTVFDMPNTVPATITLARLKEKKKLIDEQLKAVGIPLRYGLYLGADKSHFDEIGRAKDEIVGLKVFMGSSTGDLVMDDDSSLHAVFSLAASHNLVLAIHSEDEKTIHENKEKFIGSDVRLHCKIRSREAAITATIKALSLAKMYHTRLYLLHITTKEEISLIETAKKEGVRVYAEVCPHYLFLTDAAYDTLGTKAQVNPPIRTKEDKEALWTAVQKGIIDTIASDHAPHTLEEKALPFGKAPSGMPGVETTLPLLLNACHEGLLNLKDIVRLMKEKPEEIFNLPPNDDLVLIDFNKVQKVKNLKTKCGWSAFDDMPLKGWPVYTIIKGKVFDFLDLT